MNENWGLTEAGFLRPSYTELLDALEVKAKELFGSSVNLSVRSPLGIFLRIFAWFAGMLWQLAEQVYNSGFVDTAMRICSFRRARSAYTSPCKCPASDSRIPERRYTRS